ncbi:unnamed protein product [Fusarium graminearum]|uniref:Uncharacterized protein n=1 Tax=Gibberella zeae TaxID=5518 RepID=A0A4E9DTM2_GIBZA|nr:unnamed protein product [Fusarium graminearum]CAF3546438.1 unnamed protein product [Fusarium graminearum]CAG2007113.1 unnamed protein product [Fusarium graminearum]
MAGYTRTFACGLIFVWSTRNFQLSVSKHGRKRANTKTGKLSEGMAPNVYAHVTFFFLPYCLVLGDRMSRQRTRDKPAVASLFFSHTHAKSIPQRALGHAQAGLSHKFAFYDPTFTAFVSLLYEAFISFDMAIKARNLNLRQCCSRPDLLSFCSALIVADKYRCQLTTKPRDCGGTRCRVFCAEIPVDHRVQHHHQISLGGF